MNRLGSAALLASGVTLCLIAFSASASTSRTTFSVDVVVQPVAHVEQTAHGNLVISQYDVERGYIEVSEPVAMRINSNSTNGFTLNVLPVNDVFTNVVVRGMGEEVALSADGGMIVQRWQHAQTVSMNLKFQFALRPGIQPGEYSWPLRISVRPL